MIRSLPAGRVPHPKSLPAPARRLRIAQVAPPMEPVPPGRYGGTERVVSILTEELVRRGHDVTLFASGDSHTSARLVPVLDTAVWRNTLYQMDQPFLTMAVGMAYDRADQFDVIHNHLDYYAFPAARSSPTPTLTTLHGRLDLPEMTPLYRHFNDMPLISISDAQRSPLPFANWHATIYHGVNLDALRFNPAPGVYLAFLGRICPEKGLDVAIRVARRAGIPLRIGARMPLNQPGNPEAQRDWRYYHEQIEPLMDAPGAEYVGEITDDTKAEFLGNAAALLFPIRWPEPFGLVMPEALACGTPVVAFRHGSVPEVIEHGRTGFVVDSEDAMVDAVARLEHIGRARCRLAAETRFSPAVMAAAYERAYLALLDGHSGRPGSTRRVATESRP